MRCLAGSVVSELLAAEVANLIDSAMQRSICYHGGLSLLDPGGNEPCVYGETLLSTFGRPFECCSGVCQRDGIKASMLIGAAPTS